MHRQKQMYKFWHLKVDYHKYIHYHVSLVQLISRLQRPWWMNRQMKIVNTVSNKIKFSQQRLGDVGYTISRKISKVKQV